MLLSTMTRRARSSIRKQIWLLLLKENQPTNHLQKKWLHGKRQSQRVKNGNSNILKNKEIGQK